MFVNRQPTRRFCGPSCSASWRMSHPKIREAFLGRASREKARAGLVAFYAANDERAQRARERIGALNPMASAASRKKMSATLRRRGHKPVVRGGNGRPMPKAQAVLLAALGQGFEAEHVVPTREPRKPGGYPTHYKLDIANPAARVAVEIDGGSHRAIARREADARKDQLLTALGWTMLRFTNKEVLASPSSVVAVIMSSYTILR